MVHIFQPQNSTHRQSTNNYVNGECVVTDRLFENINPVNGSVIGLVSEAGEILADRSVNAVRTALWLAGNADKFFGIEGGTPSLSSAAG